ncbi:MAG: heat shock protein DnaJ domain protein [bacterium]|nr:heat shock protein DnaJ domain protein [bacterium]
MGIGKRIVDLAKANLNALLDKANGDTALDDLTDAELEAELQRRRERKRREEEERKAAERAAENARQRLKQQQQQQRQQQPPRTNVPPKTGAPPPRASAPPPPRREEKKKAPPPPGPPIGDKRLRELYAQLEVPYGGSFEDVKKSFRRLMRKYHPDLHAGNPQKHKTATQLTMSLTQAYNELELHLTGGRRG